MSSESDCEEFYDAEEKPATPARSRLNDEEKTVDTEKESPKLSDAAGSLTLPYEMEEELKEASRKAQENEKRRHKVEEMRRRMLTDDDDMADMSSGQSSRTSNDGIYITYNPVMATKTVESSINRQGDVHSIVSLGKVGLILGEKDNVSVLSSEDNSTSASLFSVEHNFQEKSPEPDLVASTRNDRTEMKPVPPPRRKRNKPPSVLSQVEKSESSEKLPVLSITIPEGLPSPTSAVESLAHELEYSLDIHSATRGQYVVKPQDCEEDHAENTDTLNISSLKGHSRNVNEMKKDNTPEGSLKQLNMVMRTRSDSGRRLTDMEILEQVTVLNLDTGELVPLSLAEDCLPKCLNPLSLQIMRLTAEYASKNSAGKDRESDEESIDLKKGSETLDAGTIHNKASRIKKMIGKTVVKTVNKIRTVADEVSHSRHSEDIDTSEEEMSPDARPSLKFKASSSNKGPYEFEGVRVLQELTGEHSGAVWTMKFSSCGRLLASAGQDHILRIWVLHNSYSYFDDMRQTYNAEGRASPKGNLGFLKKIIIIQENMELE